MFASSPYFYSFEDYHYTAEGEFDADITLIIDGVLYYVDVYVGVMGATFQEKMQKSFSNSVSTLVLTPLNSPIHVECAFKNLGREPKEFTDYCNHITTLNDYLCVYKDKSNKDYYDLLLSTVYHYVAA